jgi:predicted outer membrane repeat protein
MFLSSWLRPPTTKRAPKSRGPRRAAPVRFRPRLEALEDRWLPSQLGLTVTSLADSGPGTLRAAILTADAGKASNQYTISFAVNGTIDLQNPLPDLNNSIAVQGPGESNLTIEPGAGVSFASAIITVDAGQTASLSGLTIANGTAGGIFNEGTLTVANCAVVDNTILADVAPAFGSGGGIYSNGGTLTVSGCTISGNSATLHGGGIFTTAGTTTVSASTVSGNSAGDSGGGIESDQGTLTVSGSTTVSGNSAGFFGGGIFFGGTLTLSNSTLSGNSSGDWGGGIFAAGAATITDSTLSGNNSAPQGGGIFNDFGAMTVSGSTITGNSASFQGGGIWNGASLTLSGSNLTSNSAPYGGGVYNLVATLTVDNGSTINGNSATYGGGIFNEAFFQGTFFASSVTVRDSVLTGNTATDGAAIYNDASATLEVQKSTFSRNTASDSGGAIYNLGKATVQGSTLSSNTAGTVGGGIFNGASGTLAVKDSTVLNNTAPSGADIYNLGVLTLDEEAETAANRGSPT